MSALRYGHERRTYAGSYRDEIPSRERGPVPERYVGRIMCEFPGFRVEWACPQDMRDMRRFRAVDLDGMVRGHGTPKELLRACIALAPVYAAAANFGH